MPKYRVTIVEEIEYTIDVEADSEDAARWSADDAWTQSENPFKDFNGAVHDRVATEIETIE